MITRPIVPRIPRIEVYERILSGTKDNGMKTRKDRSFQLVIETLGIKALSESANRMTRATLQLTNGIGDNNHVAVSSSEKSTDTATRCLFPNANLNINENQYHPNHPMSAYVIKLGSTSIHLVRIRAVYNVTAPLSDNIRPPSNHPLYLKASGNDSNPIPMRILTELNIVCASVLYN